MKSIIDKWDGAKIGEIYGLDGDGEIMVCNEWEGVTQFFKEAWEALNYIQYRMAPEYELR